MRKTTYNQIAEELSNALEAIGYDYDIIDDCSSIISLVKGDFAYYTYGVCLPKIVLPCGITIEDVHAEYPCDSYMQDYVPNSDDYGLDTISDADVWTIPDDLQVYHDEDEIDDPDFEPYTDEDLVYELKFGVLDDFLRYPKTGFSSHLKTRGGSAEMVPFDTIAKAWLSEVDLDFLSRHEDDMVMGFGGDEVITEYVTCLAKAERMPPAISLDELRDRNNKYCNGELDLSHFEDEYGWS